MARKESMSEWHPFPETVVIGLGYKARSGKDTVAKHIASQIPGVRILGFATALKAHCRVAFGMRDKNPILLQFAGTDVYRAANPGMWVRILYDTLLEDPPSCVIIPDVRFPNEAGFIKAMSGYLVRVDRPGYVAPDRDAQHPSETALDGYAGWDMVISADSGDLVHLRDQAMLAYGRALHYQL